MTKPRLVEWDGDDEWADRDLPESCERCGGAGHLEYLEADELWGEDCPSEVNHLVPCPTCHGAGVRKS